MRKNTGEFDAYRDKFIRQIEGMIGNKISNFEFAYFDSLPEKWILFNNDFVVKMLFESGEKYLLAFYHGEENDGQLTSSSYAIIDADSGNVVRLFYAMDEG